MILCQWGKALGANVIGTVAPRTRGKLAWRTAPITSLLRKEDFPARVKEITKGELCAVVYDGIGKTTFPARSTACVSSACSQASAAASGRSRRSTSTSCRPRLAVCDEADAEHLRGQARGPLDIKNCLTSSQRKVKIPINQKYKLKDAMKAHQDSRAATPRDLTILVP